MKNKVPVSVIIPCYRCKDTIARAMVSVAKQTMLPGEVILVDDCSDDGTLDYLKVLHTNFNNLDIKVDSLKANGGPSVARNAGWVIAKMPYLAFLDADDTWHPNKLEIQYKWMAEHLEVDICGHRRQVVKNEAKSADISDFYTTELIDKQKRAKTIKRIDALIRNPFSTSTVMLKREIVYRFDPYKYYSEDYLLWLTCLLSGLSINRLEVVLSYRYSQPFGEGGLSRNLVAMQKGNMENYRKLYALGLLTKAEEYFFKAFSLIKFLRRCFLLMVNKLDCK